MGSRKRSKLNPKAEAERKATPPSPETDSQHKGSREPTLESVLPSDTPESAKPSKVPATEASTLQSGGSWYGRTWPRGSKANPVTQVVKESISAAGGKASEAVASARARTPALPTTPLKSPAVYLSRSIGSSSRSLPLAATTTKLNITSGVTIPAHGATRDEHMLDSDGDRFREHKVQPNDSPSLAEEKTETTGLQNRPAGKEAPESLSKDKIVDGAKTGNDSASWLSWFSKAETARDATRINAQSCSDGDPTNGIDKYSAQNSVAESHEDASPSPKQRRNSEPNPVPPMVLQEENPRYWLGLWSNATAQTKTSSFASATGIASNPLKEGYEPNIKDQNSDEAKPDSVSIPIPLPQPENVGKSYNWAFWSRDQPRNENGKQRSESTVGETVVAGSQSQSEPGNAVINETGGVSSKAGKMQRSYLLETADKSKKLQITDDDAQNVPKFVVASEAPKAKPDANAGSKAKRLPDNLLLPSLKSTYKIEQRPSLIQQISRLFPISSSSDPPKHVNIMQCQPRIKRALAIGVHGYFPAPLIRSVLGQPTGTSIRFANSAANAIQRWTQNQGYSCEIEKVALEGEGKIAERIDLLWKLMLNWIDKIRKAELVMIACHSQGVPVALMLVAKLIAFGCVNSAKIGVCAMAGVNLGPFADYKSRLISGSARELFDFALPESQVSKDYEVALDVALKFGVKVVYIGSIDDQLVSLESSTFSRISHPHIYRAAFVDGRVHVPDFLTHLVGFALKVRNLGISDHGLIRELSNPLAGSLYGGEGHSRIYDDEAVYYLAVEHALETTTLSDISLRKHREGPTTSQNPYILPFAMRGLLEEDYVRSELYGEITELIKQFDDWKPSSKVLKDVKLRLEGLRSKL